MGRVGYVPSLLSAEFVMGRVGHVPSWLCAELSLNLTIQSFCSCAKKIRNAKIITCELHI